MAASSAPATARNTTLPAASAAVRHRKTSRSPPTPSSPTARSGSADLPYSPGFDHERKFHLPAAGPMHAVDRAAAANWRADPFLVRRLSDAAQPELLVDLRRHPLLHCRTADRHWLRARHALY